MKGVMRGQVALECYRSEWAQEFTCVKEQLQTLLGGDALAIHHIGSTAVPGILAKPVLDVAVVVRAVEELDATRLEAAGYERRGEAGVPGHCLFVLRDGQDRSLRHIHCYPPGHANLTACLLFRDYLKQHPESAREYAALKRELVCKFPKDRSRYTQEKEAFIVKTVAAARESGLENTKE